MVAFAASRPPDELDRRRQPPLRGAGIDESQDMPRLVAHRQQDVRRRRRWL
jgi:hypothetical protein